jgi:hypothetical protein
LGVSFGLDDDRGGGLEEGIVDRGVRGGVLHFVIELVNENIRDLGAHHVDLLGALAVRPVRALCGEKREQVSKEA